MAREPEHKPDVRHDAPRATVTGAHSTVTGARASTRSDTVAGGAPRPTINSNTSDQLQFIIEAHAAVFSPDELSVLNAAVVELRACEDLIAPKLPVVRDVPYVAQDGASLTCTMGNWENEPASYEYGWHRDGAFVVGGPGPAGAAYPVVTEDVGTTFTCVVTATNDAGSTVAPPSNGVVVTAPPGTRAAREA